MLSMKYSSALPIDLQSSKHHAGLFPPTTSVQHHMATRSDAGGSWMLVEQASFPL